MDSSDYSTLANTTSISEELIAIKEKLLSWSRSGEVEFRFSAAHIIEIAPVDTGAENSAEARAEFLSELCGKKCLISFDQLMFSELEIYALNRDQNPAPFSDEGNWFPDFPDGIFSVLDADCLTPSNLMPKFDHLPRDARRKAEREIFKDGRLRQGAKRTILRDAGETIRSILIQYPMQKHDADVLLRYLIGDATKDEADTAFYASLRDPKWMMRWFRNQRNQMLPIIEYLRDPANKIHIATATASEEFKQYRKNYRDQNDNNSGPPELSNKAHFEMKIRWLKTISETILEKRLNIIPQFDLKRLQRIAPGFNTAVCTLSETVWASTSEKPRKSMASDFVDAIHSVYAPYVDIYRTDAFMTPVVSKYVKSQGTVVVGKLTLLADAIESRLRGN